VRYWFLQKLFSDMQETRTEMAIENLVWELYPRIWQSSSHSYYPPTSIFGRCSEYMRTAQLSRWAKQLVKGHAVPILQSVHVRGIQLCTAYPRNLGY
jgi:hypothetical protein